MILDTRSLWSFQTFLRHLQGKQTDQRLLFWGQRSNLSVPVVKAEIQNHSNKNLIGGGNCCPQVCYLQGYLEGSVRKEKTAIESGRNRATKQLLRFSAILCKKVWGQRPKSNVLPLLPPSTVFFMVISHPDPKRPIQKNC